jgi:hypothetical protein
MRTKLAISLLVIGVAAWSQTAGEPAWTKYSHDGLGWNKKAFSKA